MAHQQALLHLTLLIFTPVSTPIVLTTLFYSQWYVVLGLVHQENGEEKLFPDSNDKLMSEKCQITSLWQHL